MIKNRILFAVFVLGVVLALPRWAAAQYGGQGSGSALSANPMSHQGQVKPGVDARYDLARDAGNAFQNYQGRKTRTEGRRPQRARLRADKISATSRIPK